MVRPSDQDITSFFFNVHTFFLFIELVKNLLRKINYHSLQSALKDLQLKESLIQFIEERKQVVKSDPTPESDNNTIKQQRGEEALVNDLLQSEELLKEMHHILFEYHIVNGVLICPTTGREFIVKDGIPNMLLHEDEV